MAEQFQKFYFKLIYHSQVQRRHLQSIEYCLSIPKFHLECTKYIYLPSFTKEDFLFSLAIKDAYLCVPIISAHQPCYPAFISGIPYLDIQKYLLESNNWVFGSSSVHGLGQCSFTGDDLDTPVSHLTIPRSLQFAGFGMRFLDLMVSSLKAVLLSIVPDSNTMFHWCVTS